MFKLHKLLKGISFGLQSLVLVHLFALFGIFAAVSYPFWWYFFPKKTDENRKSFSGMLQQTALLVVFSIVSVGLLLGESYLLQRLNLFPPAKTASIELSRPPQIKNLEVFPFKVLINTPKNAVNTVQTDLSFDPSRLKAVQVDVQDSFADIFVQKEIDNEQGFLRLAGGLPSPGFRGSSGLFATVYFQALAPGATQIAFLPTSQVMSDDGHGTNILNDYAVAQYIISPNTLSAEEQAAQAAKFNSESVLGTSTNKMLFFDNYPTPIVSEVQREPKPATLSRWVFSKLDTYNQFIFRLWQLPL